MQSVQPVQPLEELLKLCATINHIKDWNNEFWTRMLPMVFQDALELVTADNVSKADLTVLNKMALRVVYGAGNLPLCNNAILGAVKWIEKQRSHLPTFAFMSELLRATFGVPEAFEVSKNIIFYETVERKSGNEQQRLLMFGQMYMEFCNLTVYDEVGFKALDRISKKISDLVFIVAKGPMTLFTEELRIPLVRASWEVLSRDEAFVRSGKTKPAQVIKRYLYCTSIIFACGIGFSASEQKAAREHVVRRLCSIARSFYKADPDDVATNDLAIVPISSLCKAGDRIDSVATIFHMMTADNVEAFTPMLMCIAMNKSEPADDRVLFCANPHCRNMDGPSELELKTYASKKLPKMRFCSQACCDATPE